ncbi:LVIVD repeat-containing protein [Halorarius litoreus]|uniref:LVIVD repeat-containing protein n=1 Tax=Halorarius litoreus TaxID=2962676 RepID=UPI0020CB75BA|nr:hypothetical protein [Halorarius litoreus]
MRRRDALRAAGVALTLPTLATGASGRTVQSGFQPLGRVPLTGAKEAVVGDDGFVYVAVTDGFAVVDVSDPAAPEIVYEDRNVLGDHDDGPMRGIYDVKVDGDRLAVTGPANPGPQLRAVVVYDVSDPTAPEQVSVHETDFFNHNCDISDGVVALCGNDGDRNPLVLVDAETGEELGRWSVVSQDPTWQDVRFIHWPLHDVTLDGDVAYLAQWDAGTWLVDVSDPTTPELAAKVRGQDASEFVDLSSDASSEAGRQPPGNDHFAAPNDDGTIVGISVEAWDVDNDQPDVRPGSVHLYDVSDPASPTKLSEIEAPPTDDEDVTGVWTTSHNFEIRGDRLFTSWYRGGVKVHDISDPANPREFAHFRDSATTSFWTAQYATESFFVASSRKDPSQTESSFADGPGAAIYTFPVPDGPVATATPTATPASGSPTATASPTASPTAPSESPSPTTGASGPGLGLLTGAAALGLGAAWRALRREDE